MTREDFDKEMNLLLKLGHSRMAVFLSTHDQSQREAIESLRRDRDMFYSQMEERDKLLAKREEEIARLREILRKVGLNAKDM